MAHWTKPRTWVDGETLTAAVFNTHLRDNLDFLRDADRVHAVQTQDNALKNDEWELLRFGGEAFDRGDMHNSRKREGQITFRQRGLYCILFKIAFEAIDAIIIEDIAAATGTDEFTKASHGLENGDVITLRSLGTITGVSTNTNYYVVRASSDTFKVSTSLGGSAENLTGSNDTVTAVRVPGERSVMLRRNANGGSTGGHSLGVWISEATDDVETYTDGYVLTRMAKGDHLNLFVKQNSGAKKLKALSGSSGTSYLQAVQMGG